MLIYLYNWSTLKFGHKLKDPSDDETTVSVFVSPLKRRVKISNNFPLQGGSVCPFNLSPLGKNSLYNVKVVEFYAHENMQCYRSVTTRLELSN